MRGAAAPHVPAHHRRRTRAGARWCGYVLHFLLRCAHLPRRTAACSATRICKEAAEKGEDDAAVSAEGFSFALKPADLTALRATASDITEKGARLYELLRREGEVREARAAAL